MTAELVSLLLRGAIVNRTYGIDTNPYIYTFLQTIFGPINYGPRDRIEESARTLVVLDVDG